MAADEGFKNIVLSGFLLASVFIEKISTTK